MAYCPDIDLTSRGDPRCRPARPDERLSQSRLDSSRRGQQQRRFVAATRSSLHGGGGESRSRHGGRPHRPIHVARAAATGRHGGIDPQKMRMVSEPARGVTAAACRLPRYVCFFSSVSFCNATVSTSLVNYLL